MRAQAVSGPSCARVALGLGVPDELRAAAPAFVEKEHGWRARLSSEEQQARALQAIGVLADAGTVDEQQSWRRATRLARRKEAIVSRPGDRLRLAASSLAQVGNRNQSEGGGMRRTILLIAVLVLALAPSASAKDNFVATLSGDEEVPARDTPAVGVAKFKLSKDGSALSFKVNVANIQNVFAAHIHCGAVGVNGPIGVTLFMGAPAGGRVNGTLAEGTITAPDPGNGCGWTSLAAVLAAIESGNTYVNVHTNDGVAPPNTGPGDFPGGEIRGQIR